MKSENFMPLYRVHLLFINELGNKHSVITAQNLRRFRGERREKSVKIFSLKVLQGLVGREAPNLNSLANLSKFKPLEILFSH